MAIKCLAPHLRFTMMGGLAQWVVGVFLDAIPTLGQLAIF